MTMRRKSSFPSKQAIQASFSAKPPFNTWTKGSLESYINHGFKPSTNGIVHIYLFLFVFKLIGRKTGGMELKIAKEQEAEFYRMGSAHGAYDLMPKLHLPFLIILGAQSDFSIEYYKPIIDRSQNAFLKEIDGSHFFPMEYPGVVADLAWQFVKRHVVEGVQSRSKL